MGATDPPSTARKARTKSPKARGTETDEEQSARFKETARSLDADGKGEEFLRALDVILPRGRKSKAPPGRG